MAKAPSRAANFGRALGMGARFAARSLTEPRPAAPASVPPAPLQTTTPQIIAPSGRVAAPAPGTAPSPAAQAAPSRAVAAGEAAGRSSRGVVRGLKNFFRALATPLARASHALWLETTGLFFALFALFFLGHAVQLRASALHGPDHPRFLLFSATALLFLYFCLDSFHRARKRSRR